MISASGRVRPLLDRSQQSCCHILAKLTAKHYPTMMPRGTKGEKSPADVNARAVMIAKIATGEIKDVVTDDGKNAAAVALGRMGGKARAAGMSDKKRKEIARKAAVKPWSKKFSVPFRYAPEYGRYRRTDLCT